jgi:hypothetical protein
MARDCPGCGLTNPTEAQRCDCGYDFTTHQVRSSYLTDKQLVQIYEDTSEATKIRGLALFGSPYALFFALFVILVNLVEGLGGLGARAIKRLKELR